ncbi:MAG TPA: hypothetical protein VFD03_09020 [Clostridia bacterium]|nr:hypothetical protein [Clostridia bacterium]
MIMLKTKFAKFAMGLMIVSVMSLGAVSTVNAAEIQSDLDDNANATTVADEETPVVDEVTPAAIDEETPVVDEVTPAAIDEETPVVDEATPVVDEVTPAAIDEATPVEITKISIYAQLLNTYDKLLNLYETLLNNFELGTSI